jgi:23S rRNA (cytidine2498-2'-O)-methyltransferase
MGSLVATANSGYAPLAMEEVRRIDPDARVKGLAAGETFLIEVPAGTPAEMAEWVRRLREREPVFLRHLFPVDEALPLPADAEETEGALVRFAGAAGDDLAGRKVAVQIRKSPDSPFPLTTAAAREAIARPLAAAGAEIVMREADRIVSVYADRSTLYMGVSAPRDNLSDWPGGAMRFRREEGLVSRAAFKLLEAERTFRLPLERTVHALDLGAAPGGWTSVLLARGARVTAVDPADLHPSLYGHPRLRHIRRNAAHVTFPPGTFDLLLCDMSWDPYRTCKIVCGHAAALSAGAPCVVTLKLMGRKPLRLIADLTAAYAEHFDIGRVKQLFHNRDEVTLVMRRKA